MSSCLVRSYTPNNWGHIAPLFEKWPFKPLARHDQWSKAELLNFTCERVQGTLGKEDGAKWVALSQGEAHGFACLTMLPWDSEQLGMLAARVAYLVAQGDYREQMQIKGALLEQVVLEAHDRGVWHLSARVDSSDLSALHALEEAGFITVDGLLTLALDLANYQPSEQPHDFRIRLATPDDSEMVAELGRTTFSYDRFHADPYISRERAGQLHANWLRNSCTGKAADAVVLAEDHTGLLGFMTCALQHDTGKKLGRLVGTIVLVATSEAARGRGVASATITTAIDWFRQQGCEIVDTGTQIRNLPSLRFFQKSGFRIVGSSASLRRLL